MPTAMRETDAPSCWTTEYWLTNCEGYRVFSEVGLIGYVEEVLRDRSHQVTALIVRAGPVFAHVIDVSVSEIEGLDPPGERVFVSAGRATVHP
jgi:hypothetical protein